MTGTLRRTVNVVSALGAIALVVFISYYSSAEVRERRAMQAVSADVTRFRQVLAYRAASNETATNSRGWPVTVDPQWFGNEPPRNGLVSPERPWVEVATPAEASLQDPPVRLTVDPKLAAFWYNPYQGVVRARVPVSISDAKALAMYNAINGTRLATIYGVTPEEPAHEASAPEPAPTASAGEGAGDDSVGPPLPSKH